MNNQTYTLQQLLTAALTQNNINYFAYALALSKREPPTVKSIELTLQIASQNKDIRWLEVLERQAILDYDLVFQICKDSYWVYPTLIVINNPIVHFAELAYIQNKMFEIMRYPNVDTQVKWNAFVHMTKAIEAVEDERVVFEYVRRLNHAFEEGTGIVQEFQQLQTLQKASEETADTIYSTTTFQGFLNIVRLIKRCCRITRRRMEYLSFISTHHSTLQWIRTNYSQLIVKAKEVCTDRNNSITRKQQDVYKCLLQLENFVEVEDIAADLSPHLISTLISNRLLPVPQRCSDLNAVQDQLLWEYGLINHNYGEDTPSYLSRIASRLSQCLPGFLRKFITTLGSSTHLAMNQSEMLMKIAVVHRQINQRRDLSDELIHPLLQLIFSQFKLQNSSMQSQMVYCRKLRLLFLFAEVLKEAQFSRVIQAGLYMIKTENHTTFCFNEGYNLINHLCLDSNKHVENHNELSRVSVLIKQETGTITHALINIIKEVYQLHPINEESSEREGKLVKIYRLLLDILNSNQTEAEQICPQITCDICEWTKDEIEANWRRGVKTTMPIDLLMKISSQCVTMIKQCYYNDVFNSIYLLLDILTHLNSYLYEQELLHILVLVLNIEKMVNPHTCTILTSLSNIIKHNNNSIYPLRSVIKVLCSKQISSSVLFDWPDLCLFYFNILVTFFSRSACSQYPHIYNRQWQELISLFGLYLQAYADFLENNPDIRNNLLECINKFADNELKLQLFLILNNQKAISTYRFYSFQKVADYKYRNTFKLLHFFYGDCLRTNFSQQLLQQYIEFNKIYREKQMRREFENQVHSDWPILETNIHIYIKEAIKSWKKQRKIDESDYQALVHELLQNI